jgi:MFS family permease
MTRAGTRGLTRGELRTLVLSAMGGALEFYDFIVFVFFAAVMAQLFFPPELPEWVRQLQTFGIFAAGYLARPVGGIVMAHFGDRAGRKRMFMLSVLLMAVPTLLIALLPVYASVGLWAPLLLLLMRLLQGAAVGGEVPGAWVFVSEHVPPHRVGLACGVLTGGLTLGILMGSLAATAVNTLWSPAEVHAWAWRLPFVLGGAFGMLAVWLRTYLHETPVFEAMRAQRALVTGLPIKQVLHGHGRSIAVSMLLTWFLTAGIVVVILMTPTFAQTAFGVSAAQAQSANSVATLMLTFGCAAFGVAADRWGAWRTIGIGSLLLAISTLLLYAALSSRPAWFAPAYALAGFTVGVVGVVPVLMVRLFPPAIRFSGISFAYNIAYAISGGLTPLLVTLWMVRDSMSPVWYVALACASTVATTVLMTRPSRARAATA